MFLYADQVPAMLQCADDCAEQLVSALVHLFSILDPQFTPSQLIVVINALVLGHTKQTLISETFSLEELIGCRLNKV